MLLCNKLLLHTTLPLPSLILLVHLLDMLQAQQPESDSGTQPQTTLVGVTSTLAQVVISLLFPPPADGMCRHAFLPARSKTTVGLWQCKSAV